MCSYNNLKPSCRPKNIGASVSSTANALSELEVDLYYGTQYTSLLLRIGNCRGVNCSLSPSNALVRSSLSGGTIYSSVKTTLSVQKTPNPVIDQPYAPKRVRTK